MRGHSAIAQSHSDLAEVITQTVRLWRKADAVKSERIDTMKKRKQESEDQPLLPNAFDTLCLLTIAQALRELNRWKLADTITYLADEGGESAIVDDLRSLKEELPTTAPDFDYYDFKQRVLSGWDDDNALLELADELDKVNQQIRRAEEAFALRYPPDQILEEFSRELEIACQTAAQK